MMRRPLNKVRRPREGGDPVSCAVKPLDSRLRGNDGNVEERRDD